MTLSGAFLLPSSSALLAPQTLLHVTVHSPYWHPAVANPGFSLAQGGTSVWGTVLGQVKDRFCQHQALPASARWYSGSLWKLPGQSLCELHCGPSAASSWQFSARCCGTWGRGCWPGCPGPRGWQWPGSWLYRRKGTREPTTLMGDTLETDNSPSTIQQADVSMPVTWVRIRSSSTELHNLLGRVFQCEFWGAAALREFIMLQGHTV